MVEAPFPIKYIRSSLDSMTYTESMLGGVDHAALTVSWVAVLEAIVLICPAPVPDRIRTWKLAQLKLQFLPVSVSVEAPPDVAVPRQN